MADTNSEIVKPVPPVDPSKLTFETVPNRRRIIASYWLIVLLAIPLWWKTTSIDRLSLPESRVKGLSGKHISFPVNVELTASRTLLPSLQDSLSRWIKPAAEANGLTVTINDRVAEREAGPGAYRIQVSGDAETTVDGRHLHVSLDETRPNPSQDVAELVTKLLIPHASQSASEEHRTVKYAPRYRLAFTLLNEDATSGQGAHTWDVSEAVQDYLKPALDRLSILHNFTIESQVQYHAPLAFQPRPITTAEGEAHGITPEDLTVFVNSAEWTLASSVSNDPVLHFVLFVPSSHNTPLYILDHAGNPTTSDAFLLPQWGGIILLNQPPPHLSTALLRATFQTFQRQLLSLLGVPSLPPGVRSTTSDPFTDWQLDALVRQRARQNFENSKETLSSIVALVHQIENMPVGQDVKGDVQGALNALDAALATAPVSSTAALRHSSEALTLASRAFFNPGMLALLYFPAEHKYAVYTPLFASIAAPLVAAVIRELWAWRKARHTPPTGEGRPKTD